MDRVVEEAVVEGRFTPVMRGVKDENAAAAVIREAKTSTRTMVDYLLVDGCSKQSVLVGGRKR